jgi:choline dehydrogenase-like flavoprotein
MAAPNVHFDDHPNDVAMREYAYEKAEALYKSVGAVQTVRTPPYPSTHNLGTNRMSEKPEDGVVDKWGRAHDMKNLFISDGSVMTSGAAANPTLTITALAIRQGEYLANELKKGNL